MARGLVTREPAHPLEKVGSLGDQRQLWLKQLVGSFI